MTELDCPTCHQRYKIPEEMKNHLEEVHKINRAYMDWIFLLEDRISELQATRMNKYSVRGPDLNLAQLGNPACPTSAT